MKILKTNTPGYPNLRNGSGLKAIKMVKIRKEQLNIKATILNVLLFTIATIFSLIFYYTFLVD